MFNAIKDDERENVIAKRHCVEKAAVEKKTTKVDINITETSNNEIKKKRAPQQRRKEIFFYYSYVSTNDENGIAEQ